MFFFHLETIFIYAVILETFGLVPRTLNLFSECYNVLYIISERSYSNANISSNVTSENSNSIYYKGY